MTVMLLVTWWRVGRDILPPRELLAVPGYVLGKIGLYTGFVRHRQTKWVRTDRN